MQNFLKDKILYLILVVILIYIPYNLYLLLSLYGKISFIMITVFTLILSIYNDRFILWFFLFFILSFIIGCYFFDGYYTQLWTTLFDLLKNSIQYIFDGFIHSLQKGLENSVNNLQNLSNTGSYISTSGTIK